MNSQVAASKVFTTTERAIDAARTGRKEDAEPWANPADVLQGSPLLNAPRVELTGFPTLTKVTRGGIPIGAVVVLVGAPGSGKTTLGIQIARLAREQLGAHVVGFFGDEGNEAAATKLGQQIGCNREKLEAGDKQAFAGLRVYGAGVEGMPGSFSLVHPDEDLRVTISKIREKKASDPDGVYVLVVDNAQCSNFDAESGQGSVAERDRITAMIKFLRKAALQTPLLPILISEANRGSYAAKDSQKRTSGLASAADSRGPEYKADFFLALEERSDGLVDVEVSKNRVGLRLPGIAGKPHLFLRHNPDVASYEEVDMKEVEDQKEKAAERQHEQTVSKLADRVLALLIKNGPLNVAAIQERTGAKRSNLLAALNGLEARGEARWTRGPKNSRVWEAVVRG